MDDLKQLLQQIPIEELRLAAKILNAPIQPKFPYANLLKNAKFGDEISLGKFKVNSWRFGPQGIFFRRDEEFFQILDKGLAKSLGKHKIGGWDDWEVNAQGIFTYHGAYRGNGGELYRVLGDGLEKSLGQYEFAQWRLGPQGVFVVYENDMFVQILEDKSGRSLGGHKWHKWEVDSRGIVISYDDELFRVTEDGKAKRLGKFKDGFFRIGPQGIFISCGDDGIDFFQIFDDGSKKSLGNHKCDHWRVGSQGIFIFRGDTFFQILDDNSERPVYRQDRYYLDDWQVGAQCLVIHRDGEFILAPC